MALGRVASKEAHEKDKRMVVFIHLLAILSALIVTIYFYFL